MTPSPGGPDRSADDAIAKTRQYFNATYPGPRAEPSSPMQRLAFDRIASLIPPGRPDQTAVDLGCHWGRYTRHLARTYGQVWGVDVAADALRSAPEAPNVRFRVMDLEDEGVSFGFGGRVDLFTAIGLLELLRDPATLSRRLGEAATAGCRVLIVIPNRSSIHYRAFRLMVWIARHVLRRDSLYIHNNGVKIKDLVGWMGCGGFRTVGQGKLVGLPLSIVDRLPVPFQRLLIPLERAALLVLGGSYHWALFAKEASVAGPVDR